ncbi:MAG TPA: isomerase, partial [Rhizobiales bacterium]|nr:isomerase [Hyphomicrobiales bacterium]
MRKQEVRCVNKGNPMTVQFSANTGFLWKELPFLERIRHAAATGFDALEFHDEAQDADRSALRAALAEAGLPVLGLNCAMRETAGCAAMAGQEAQARRDIIAAAQTASDIEALAIHVLSGKAGGRDARARYLSALEFALENTPQIILIEPISPSKIPGYFLTTIEQAAGIIRDIGSPRLKIMFDCFHIMAESGAVVQPFMAHADMIGHVQIASFPGRNEPGHCGPDYAQIIPAFQQAGYQGAYGCEYIP